MSHETTGPYPINWVNAVVISLCVVGVICILALVFSGVPRVEIAYITLLIFGGLVAISNLTLSNWNDFESTPVLSQEPRDAGNIIGGLLLFLIVLFSFIFLLRTNSQMGILEDEHDIFERRRQIISNARETREMNFWERAINENWVNPKNWRLRRRFYKEIPKEERYID